MLNWGSVCFIDWCRTRTKYRKNSGHNSRRSSRSWICSYLLVVCKKFGEETWWYANLEHQMNLIILLWIDIRICYVCYCLHLWMCYLVQIIERDQAVDSREAVFFFEVDINIFFSIQQFVSSLELGFVMTNE